MYRGLLGYVIIYYKGIVSVLHYRGVLEII